MNLFRRRFLQSFSFATSGVALGGKPVSRRKQMVDWHVAGFTCRTCAVGLETLLSRRPGILQVQAKYPEGTVRIEFDPAKVNERELRDAIVEMGFRVEPGV